MKRSTLFAANRAGTDAGALVESPKVQSGPCAVIAQDDTMRGMNRRCPFPLFLALFLVGCSYQKAPKGEVSLATKPSDGGMFSWETTLEWQPVQSFVLVDNKVEVTKGHPGKRIIVPVTFQDSQRHSFTARLQLDTGADQTIINDQRFHVAGGRIEHLGGVGGAMSVTITTLESFSVGPFTRKNFEVAIGPLPGGKDAPDGLLGQDFLRRYIVTIDYRSGKLRLEHPAREDNP
jgi:hypothetical protein